MDAHSPKLGGHEFKVRKCHEMDNTCLYIVSTDASGVTQRSAPLSAAMNLLT